MTVVKKINVFKVVTLLSICVLSACSKLADDKTTIRVAHMLDTQHPVHNALVYMNERIQHHSNGQMEFVLYPSGQLGSERELIELVQIGTLGITKVSASSLEAFVPNMKVFSVPYLFNDEAHHWRVLKSEVGKKLLADGEEFLVKGLGYFDAGSRSFYTTNKSIQTPDDLKGLKIRVMNSESAVKMVNTMGGAATPVSFGELYTALQQGIVDGAENNPPSLYYSKHFEVSHSYILDEHTSIPDVIIIATHLWNKLNAEQQQWLTTAMRETEDFQRALWAEATAMALEEVRAAGVNVIIPDKTEFKASVAPIYEALKDTQLMPLVEQIQALGEQI